MIIQINSVSMVTSLVMGGAVVLLLYTFYFSFRAKPDKDTYQLSATSAGADQYAAETNPEAMQHLSEEEVWWHKLTLEDQLELAVQLARKALPTWENYAGSNELVYRNAGTGPSIKIDPQLLFCVLQDVQQLYYSGAANSSKLLHQYYDSFVGPVIAMQDGDWPATYPVKKIFLAVYNIIKSTLDQDNPGNAKNLLYVSINQSLDCLDISGAHSKVEIIEFLAAYKNQLQIKAV